LPVHAELPGKGEKTDWEQLKFWAENITAISAGVLINFFSINEQITDGFRR